MSQRKKATKEYNDSVDSQLASSEKLHLKAIQGSSWELSRVAEYPLLVVRTSDDILNVCVGTCPCTGSEQQDLGGEALACLF